MDRKKFVFYISMIALIFYAVFYGDNESLLVVPFIIGHCDTMDGPVIKDAQKALEKGNVNLVLHWVNKEDENIIKETFDKTMEVRTLSLQAKELADRHFFETLVRIHRAAEGEPFTGLKPAGTEIDPGIEAADGAVENENAEDVINQINKNAKEGILERFNKVMEKKKFAGQSVETGREYVKAYVSFIHYVEKLLNAVSSEHNHH